MYVVITPATGDMRRLEEEDDPTMAHAHAVASARPGDIVALIRRGSITRVWTARGEPDPDPAEPVYQGSPYRG